MSRWIDGVLEKNELIDQDSNLRGVVYWGHAPNSQTRGLEMKRAMDKLDLLVVVDPYPSATAAMAAMPGRAEDLNPNRAVYLLPACTQFETSGSVTASNRSLQWREKVIEPLWESRSDHMIMQQFADQLGFGKELSKNYKMQKVKGMDEPVPDDILREINKCCWTIGYTGQSPERLQAHMRNMAAFDVRTLKAKGSVKDKVNGYDITGDYFGLPWPCYGTPELKHPGSPNLYDTSKHVMDGGGNFRANFGVERNGKNLLAEDGSHSLGADITTGYPELDHLLLKKLGWWDELTEAEKAKAEGKNWKTDQFGRHDPRVHEEPRLPSLRQRQGARRGVELPDAIPQHREPLYGTRPDLVGEVPDARRQDGLLAPAHALQERSAAEHRRQDRGEVPVHHDLRPPGRIRGRRRGDALQSLAGRAAAGDVHRDQSEGGGREGHPQRRARLGPHAHRARGSTCRPW